MTSVFIKLSSFSVDATLEEGSKAGGRLAIGGQDVGNCDTHWTPSGTKIQQNERLSFRFSRLALLVQAIGISLPIELDEVISLNLPRGIYQSHLTFEKNLKTEKTGFLPFKLYFAFLARLDRFAPVLIILRVPDTDRNFATKNLGSSVARKR